MGMRQNKAGAAQQAQQTSRNHSQVELDSEALRPALIWGTLGGGCPPQNLPAPHPSIEQDPYKQQMGGQKNE